MGYSRIRALFNYPIKLKNDQFLFLGLDYSNIEIDFDAGINTFDTSIIQDFQLLDFSIAYTFKMNADWRFAARFSPGFSSNLVRDISFEDAVFSGDVVFIKDKKDDQTMKRPYRLILGVSYAGNRGIPFPLPFISYYKKFHPKWSYNIGVPSSNLQYHISERSRVKINAQLDGFNANIQNGLLVNNMDIADKVNFSLVTAGFRYEYKFSQHLEFYSILGNIFRSSAKLKDSNNEELISVDKNNTLYLRTGLRFKI